MMKPTRPRRPYRVRIGTGTGPRGRTALHPAVVLASALLLMTAACSSAPDAPERVVETRNLAARHVQFGNDYFRRGNYTQAVYFYRLALDEHRSVDHEPGVASTLNAIGKVHIERGEWGAARDAFEESREISGRTGEDDILLQSINNLGELALRRGQPADAAPLFEEAAAMAEARGDEAERAIVLHNLATARLRTGSLDAAGDHLEEARKINTDLERYAELAANYYMLASVEARSGNLESARETLVSALENDKRMENSGGIARDLMALGVVERRLGNHERSLDYLERSLAVHVTRDDVDGALRLLAELESTAKAADMPERVATYAGERQRIEAALAEEGDR
jgi:tetratricopeptide (TPR) repeat protein